MVQHLRDTTGTQAPGCDYFPDPPAYGRFLQEYLLPNRPLIIGPSLVSRWPAYEKWASGNLSGERTAVEDGTALTKAAGAQTRTIEWDYLAARYGDLEVTVADCSTHEFSDQKRETMLFRDVVELWKSGRGASLYAKDWHLARALGFTDNVANGFGASADADAGEFYSTPNIFRDDWMNAYYSAHTADDFRFVYAGAAGTFTPLHRDVYASYSWSTNVCGRKRWWLFPPEQTCMLLRRGGEEHLEVAFDVRDVDATAYPRFAEARPVVLDQNDGETIFVPSGWYHQVVNLTDCISINHNWCNSVNLPSLYASMRAKVTEVERALDDVRGLLAQNGPGWEVEWVSIVQDVVEKDAGWNWLTFWNMVLHALKVASSHATAQGPTNDAIPGRSSLWAEAPPELTPPLALIKERIRACYEDFMQRETQEIAQADSLLGVLSAIEVLLR